MIMDKFDALVFLLRGGKTNARHAYDIESSLGIEIGHTQEPTRELIREAIVVRKYPIGSTPQDGYFLIDTKEEFDEAVNNLMQRILGLERRIEGLRDGWQRRLNSRALGGNWPK